MCRVAGGAEVLECMFIVHEVVQRCADDVKHGEVQLCRSAEVQKCRSAEVQRCRFEDVQKCKSAEVEMSSFEDVQMCRCAEVQRFRGAPEV
jgi:hypothetical protein